MSRLSVTAVALLLFVSVLNGWAAPRRHLHPIIRMEATAFAKDRKPTAAGTVPHDGIVAADPAVLPLGSRVRITNAGAFSGFYIVTDTGSKVVGNHIDLYVASAAEAKRFGKRIVIVQVLQVGTGKQDARAKDIPAVTH